jgi:hypothetical protein
MIIIPLILISALSPRFEYGLADINKPIVPLVALMMASGAFFLWVILRCKGVALGRGLLAWVFILGLLARLVMFPSTPVLEDDHYRYLWDGGVLANGFNPYQYSPREVVGEEIVKVPEPLRQLAREAGPIPKRINYPWPWRTSSSHGASQPGDSSYSCWIWQHSISFLWFFAG